ncbi:MAG TPA: protein kinase [Haliangium sp.]|nr:protein kinase [Haliangium sp.]
MSPPRRHSSSVPVGQHIGDNTAVEFIEGTLSRAKMAQVEAHAARCDDCRQQLAELGRNDSQDDQVPTAPLGAEAHLALERGERVGRFEVLSRIGSGGMGVVFAAYDPGLGRKVALKLLRSPKDSGLPASDAQRRLLREAQAMAQLSHPNVIAVYDVGKYKSEVYIAMELVEGETLTRWLRRWQRPWHEILGKFLAAGNALAEAHTGGLAHRDFKPDNVLVGTDERVRVMDFGLARSLFFDGPSTDRDTLDGASGPRGNMLGHVLTRTGATMGTPRYMAPEQFTGKEMDAARSDQFSFCVALYEALYSQHPFEGDTAMGLSREDCTTRPPPDSSPAPAWLHRALVRGLSFDAKNRFPRMQDLLQAITPPPPRPSRVRLAVFAGVTGVALIYAISAWVQARDQNQQLGTEVGAARERIAELEREVEKLLREVEKLEGNTGEQQQAIRELEQRLSAASIQLAEAQQVLAARSPTGAPVLGQAGVAPPVLSVRPGRPGRPAAGAGLSPAELMRPLDPFRHDLTTCFREWLERVPEARLLLGVRVRVDASGVPALDKIVVVDGIDDRVMQECVTGNLLRLSFPTRDSVTVADYKFSRGETGALVTAVDVFQVQPAAPAVPAQP